MELQVKPHNGNMAAPGALFIKGNSLYSWLEEIRAMGISIRHFDTYAVPGVTPNTTGGCLLVPHAGTPLPDAGKNLYFQAVEGGMYIPPYTCLYPNISAGELKKLLGGKRFFFHPETGMAELPEAICWEDLVESAPDNTFSVKAPADGVSIPSEIRRLEVRALPPEETLEQMERETFPQQERQDDQPLSSFEKKKLGFLRHLFNPKAAAQGDPREISFLGRIMDRITRLFSNKPENWLNKLEKDYEDLELRNRDELQKLMDLFRDHPEEALKYAIPLDNDGTARGGETAGFDMYQRWKDFSLQGAPYGSGGGSSVLSGDVFQRLSQQYQKTAQDLIRRGNYEKAAFIYLKLLKDPATAAQTLEDGGLYAEAAALHLKYTQNQHRAAQCYIKGNMLSQALDLYVSLKEYEKAGDLCLQMAQQEEAFGYYGKVITDHVQSGRYVQASLLYRNKMNDRHSAQELLLTGWRHNKDAFNCLNNYFSNVQDVGQLQDEINHIYLHETQDQHIESFLNVLRYEHEKHPELRGRAKEIAYEIIAGQSGKRPEMISSLQHFNKDKLLVKDILRHKNEKRR